MRNIVDVIKEKGFAIGPFMKSSDPAIVEIAGYSGFDFVILDMEHGPTGLQQMQNLIRAAEVSGVVPIIRTRDRLAESISQALDIGAKAVQVPQLTNAQEVKEVVNAAKFYPYGNRGICRFVRAAQYSAIDGKKYFRESNRNQIIIQLEGKEALLNFEQIIQVPQVDILFIGPYDLSQSLGVPGEINHPKVITVMKAMVAKALKNNKYIGLFTDTLENAKMWKEIGVHYLSYSVDMSIYLSSCKEIVKSIRS